jgi:hypothetical protein
MRNGKSAAARLAKEQALGVHEGPMTPSNSRWPLYNNDLIVTKI